MCIYNIYIDFLLQVVAWTRVAEGDVTVASVWWTGTLSRVYPTFTWKLSDSDQK